MDDDVVSEKLHALEEMIQEWVTSHEATQREAIAKEHEVFGTQDVETMPQYPGGDAAVMQFLAKNIRYPAAAAEQGVQGRVIVQFTVTKGGQVNDVRVLRGVHPDLDNEAVRVVSLLSGWKPGTQGGQPVNVRYTLPVQFRLQ